VTQRPRVLRVASIPFLHHLASPHRPVFSLMALDLRQLQGEFASVLTPSPAEPYHAGLENLANATKMLTDDLAAEQAEVAHVLPAADAAAESKWKEVSDHERALDMAVKQEKEQKMAANKKKTADARDAKFKLQAEMLAKDQRVASEVAKMKPNPCGHTAKLTPAERDAANEIVRVAKGTTQDHLNQCKVRLKLGQRLASDQLKGLAAKLQEAENQTSIMRQMVADGQDAAHSPDSAAAADQRDAAQALEQALAQEDNAKDTLAAAESEAAAIQRRAEATMHQEGLVLQKREADAERVAWGLTTALRVQQVTARYRSDLERYLDVMRRGVAPSPAGTPAAQRQFKQGQARLAEMSRRVKEQEEDARRRLAEEEAGDNRGISASVQAKRSRNDALVQGREARVGSADIQASRSLEAAKVEACAAERRAAAEKEARYNEVEDAQNYADEQAKKLVEQFADIERAIPKASDDTRSEISRCIRAKQEELANARQAVIQDPHLLLSDWSERVASSHARLEALRQTPPALRNQAADSKEKAKAAELAAAEAVEREASNAEHHRQEWKAEKLRAEQQAKHAVQAAQDEVSEAHSYLAEVKQVAAEERDLQKLSHQDDIDALSRKAAARADAATRERRALNERKLAAEENVRATQREVRQSIEDAKKRAEQIVNGAKSQLPIAKRQADEAYKQGRLETDRQMLEARDALEAAEAKAANDIQDVKEEIEQNIRQHQARTEDLERLAQEMKVETLQLEERDVESLRESEAEKQRVSTEAAEAVASRKRQLHLTTAACTDRMEKDANLLLEAEEKADAVCRDVAARMEAGRLAQEQRSRELDEKAAKKEKDAVEELADIEAKRNDFAAEAKAKKDGFTAEIEAAKIKLQKLQLSGEERLRAAERWGAGAKRKAEEDFRMHDNKLRLLESQVQAAQLALQDGSQLALETQHRKVVAHRQNCEERETKATVTSWWTQRIADTTKRNDKEVQDKSGEWNAEESSIRQEALALLERGKLAEAQAPKEEEALAATKKSNEEQIERAEQERDEELTRLEALAKQREAKAARCMDCIPHVTRVAQETGEKTKEDLVDYFQKSLDTRQAPAQLAPPASAPSPFTPPASEHDATAEASDGSPMLATPSAPMRPGAINLVSSNTQAPGWGSLRPSVKSALYERSFRHSIGGIATDSPRHSIDGIVNRRPN